MPAFDQLMKPLELTTGQRAEYLSQDAVEKDEGFSFPEDLLPACTRVDSTVPLLTMVSFVAELCRWGAATSCFVNSGANSVLLWGLTIPSCTIYIGIFQKLWLVNCFMVILYGRLCIVISDRLMI